MQWILGSSFLGTLERQAPKAQFVVAHLQNQRNCICVASLGMLEVKSLGLIVTLILFTFKTDA